MALSWTLNRRALLLGSLAIPLANCSRNRNSNGLRIGISSSPDSLDPAQGQTANAALLFKQLYTPLTNYDENGNLAPGLAESWTMSEDGLRWNFKLRDGLKWSDGTPITAKDVVFSVQRMLDPDSIYTDVGDFFHVTNAKAVLSGDKPITDLGVRAPGDNMVEFSMDEPLGVFAELMREFYPAPAHILNKPANLWPLPPDFVGSGPFILDKAEHMALQLKQNPFAPDPAHIEQIYVTVVEDAATRARMVRAGDLDLVEDPPPNRIVDLQSRKDVQLNSWKSPKLVYLKINHKHLALSNRDVRSALNMTVDREFISEQLFEGFAEAANGIMPWVATPEPEPLEQRIKTAKQLMAKAGFGGGLTLTILHSGGERERIALSLADNWKQIGVICHLQGTDAQGLYSFIEMGDFDLAMASFDRGLKRENWRMIEPFASGGFAANFNWINSEYDQLVLQTRSEFNPVRRDWLAAEAADLLYGDVAIIPLVFERKFWLSSPQITGFSSEIPPDQWRFLRSN